MSSINDDVTRKDETYDAVFKFIAIALSQTPHSVTSDWTDLAEEISQSNRFFLRSDKTKILSAIDRLQATCQYKLRKGRRLYRARTYSMEELYQKYRLQEFINDFTGRMQFPDEFPKNTAFPKDNLSISISNLALILSLDVNKEMADTFEEKLVQWIEKVSEAPFWGLPADKSGAPPADRATAGRLNPEGISYLYASQDSSTAITECRPIIGQLFNIATIEINRTLCLYDFCAPMGKGIDALSEDKLILSTLSMHLAKPNYSGEKNYLPTQYIAEYIKSLSSNGMRFDGIRFPSALKKNGKNIVLFDVSPTDKYSIIRTAIHGVSEISIKQSEFMPKVYRQTLTTI